jgi:hypothetical protein
MRHYYSKKVLPFIMLTGLAACSPNYDMAMNPGYTQGNYAVHFVSIVPGSDTIAADPEYNQVKGILDRNLPNALAGKGSGAPVILQVTVLDVSTEINTMRSILVSDSYRLSASVSILDYQTRQALNQPKYIKAEAGKNSHGVLGSMVSSVMYDDNEQVNELINRFTDTLIKTVYPQYNTQN